MKAEREEGRWMGLGEGVPSAKDSRKESAEVPALWGEEGAEDEVVKGSRTELCVHHYLLLETAHSWVVGSIR